MIIDLGVYINNLMIYIKQYFVNLFMIYFQGIVNHNIDSVDKIMPLVFFSKVIRKTVKYQKYEKITRRNQTKPPVWMFLDLLFPFISFNFERHIIVNDDIDFDDKIMPLIFVFFKSYFVFKLESIKKMKKSQADM